MGLFGRKNKSRSGLLTGTISATDGGWEVTWIGDGVPEPPPFAASGLTEAAEQAAARALAAYRPRPDQPESELQLVIFPWPDGSDGGPIYEIAAGPGGLQASDFLGSGSDVSGQTLEDLVAEIGRQDAMLQWVRPFADLRPAMPGNGA